MKVFIHNCVHSRLCLFGITCIWDRAIRDRVHRDCVHFRKCPFEISIIRDCVFRDRVQDPFFIVTQILNIGLNSQICQAITAAIMAMENKFCN